MTRIVILFLALVMTTGLGRWKPGDDGFFHFKNGDKFKTHHTSNDEMTGDLYLSTGEVYYNVRLYQTPATAGELRKPKTPELTWRDMSYLGITLTNNISMLVRQMDGRSTTDKDGLTIENVSILFPNGWIVHVKDSMRTPFSNGEAPAFMFDGEVDFGFIQYKKNWTKLEEERKRSLLETLIPGESISRKTLSTSSSYSIKWSDSDYYHAVKTKMRTSAPLHQWPMNISQTKGLSSGYYGLEKDGLPFGPGSFLHDDGVLTIGNFKDGILEGIAEQLLLDGSSLKGTYVKGYKNGMFTQVLPFGEHAQETVNRIEAEKAALENMSRKERKRARKIARKAELNGTAVETPVVQMLPEKMIWQGQYVQDVQIGWWQKTLGEKVVELRHFDNGREIEMVSLGQSSTCALNAIDGEIEQFASSTASCNGTLFSAKTGTLFTDVATEGDMIVEATVVPVHPRTFEGRIASGVFSGQQYNADGAAVYVGDIKGGKKQGQAKCNFEGGLEPCEFDAGFRVDLNYLARVEVDRLKKWQDDCSSNLSDMRRISYWVVDIPSQCTVNIFKARFDEAYNRDVNETDCDECWVEILGPVEQAQKCIDGEQKGIQSRHSRVSGAAGHLRSNQCMDPQSISTLASNARKGVELRKQQLDSFQRYVSDYNSFGKDLERARKQNMRNFRANLNRDTHRDIMASLGSIQTDVDKAMRQSKREYNQIMRTYEIDKPKRYDEYQRSRAVPGRVQGASVQASGSRPMVQGKDQKVHRADELLAAYKKKCLSDPANTWKNNGCVYTIPYDGRFNCSDPTGQTCKTGEAWNPNNTAPKQLTAAHSGATSFGTSSSGSSSGGSGLTSTATSGAASSSDGTTGAICENVTRKCMSFISESTSGDYLKINVVNRCGHAVGYQLCYQSSSKGASCIGNSNLGPQGNFTHENYNKKAGDGRYNYVAWKKPAPAGCTPSSLEPNLRRF